MEYKEINKPELIEALQNLRNRVNEIWEWTFTNTIRLISLIDEYKSYASHFEALKQNTAYGLAMNFDEIDRDAEWGRDTRAKTQRARSEAEKRFNSASSHFLNEIDEMIRRIQKMIDKEQRGENPFLLGE